MQRNFQALAEKTFDMVIIGGGATGAAIAFDAALRGLSVALIDKGDFSAGTSAASTKLLHGGLRYLANGEISLVREALRERRIWQRIAKHLVSPMPFLLPIFDNFRQGKTLTHLGLTAYDWLAFDRNIGGDKAQHIPTHRILNIPQTLGLVPGLKRDGLAGGMIYHDVIMHAPERLCLALIQSAVEAGAVAVNHAEFIDFTRQKHQLTGIKVKNCLENSGRRKTITVKARLIINAAGAWADQLMQRAIEDKTASQIASQTESKRTPPKKLVRSKGIHFLTENITRGAALATPVDDEHLFVVPWQGRSLFATTDTRFDDAPDKVCVTSEDIAILLRKVQTALPGLGITQRDIIHAYAGLRPLVADIDDPANTTYGMSRGAEIVDHREAGGPSGLISALGGKWTTSRRLGEQVVDLAIKRLGQPARQCQSAKTLLVSCPHQPLDDFIEDMRQEFSALNRALIMRLSQFYGTALPDMLATDITGLKTMKDPILAAQSIYAIKHEMAMRLDDVVNRRLVMAPTGIVKPTHITAIADYMAHHFGWSAAEKKRQIAQTRAALKLPPKPSKAARQQ